VDQKLDGGARGFVVAAGAFRDWAIEHIAQFQLIYGTPLTYYRAPENGPTTAGVTRLATIFVRELFDGFTADQLARADVTALSPQAYDHLAGLPPFGIGALPPPAAALFISTWGHLHGLVVLEAFGHLSFVGPARAEIFDAAMRNLLSDLHRRIPAPARSRQT
jgi:hypothetical protein